TVDQWAHALAARLQDADPKVRNVVTDAGATGLALEVDLDRDTASRLGISAANVDDALYSAYGQRIVSTIFTETNQYRAILEARRPGHGRRRPGRPARADLERPAHAALGLRRGARGAGAAAGHARGAVPGDDDRLRHRRRRLAGPGRRLHPRCGPRHRPAPQR